MHGRLPVAKGGGAVLDHLPGRGQREVCAVWDDYCVPVLCREYCSSAPTPCSSCVCLSRLPALVSPSPCSRPVLLSSQLTSAFVTLRVSININCVLPFIFLCHCSSSNLTKVIISASEIGHENRIQFPWTV